MDRLPVQPSRRFIDRRRIRPIVTFDIVMGLPGFSCSCPCSGTTRVRFAVSIMFTSFVCPPWFNGLQAQMEHEPYLRDIRKSITINPHMFYGIGAGIPLQMIAVDSCVLQSRSARSW